MSCHIITVPCWSSCFTLTFHIQVDVVDSEFCTLLEEASSASDFQSVLRAHRNFLATIMRLSSIDNLVIQEGIERVLQVCLRFIAVCRLLHQQEENITTGNPQATTRSYSPLASDVKKRIVPVVVPPEEIDGVRKEFFTQISYLFQIMRKVENRGLMFRLDFNGYLSALSEDLGAGLDRWTSRSLRGWFCLLLDTSCWVTRLILLTLLPLCSDSLNAEYLIFTAFFLSSLFFIFLLCYSQWIEIWLK